MQLVVRKIYCRISSHVVYGIDPRHMTVGERMRETSPLWRDCFEAQSLYIKIF